MQEYVQIYLDAFGYTDTDFIPCEICQQKAVDIHHIKRRGMGGSNSKDEPENLIALCREDHVEYGDKKKWMQMLIETHERFMILRK